MSVEKLIHQATMTDNSAEREQIIHELAHAHSTNLNDILAILQSPKESLWPIAIRIIQTIEYPDNMSTLPTIIDHASDWNSIVQQEAQQCLLKIGVPVLPFLLDAARENDVVEDWIDYLGTTLDLSGERGEHIINELAAHPKETLPALIYLLEHPLKPWWTFAVRAIRAMGFPESTEAVPILIDHASNWNSPDQDEAFQTLKDLGVEIMTPYFLDALLNDSQRELHQTKANAVCALLLHLDRQFALPCGPALTFLISHSNFSLRYDIIGMLKVLEMIGPPEIAYALPMLLSLSNKRNASELSNRAQHLINAFDQKTIKLYEKIIE
jgi:hypothetical protein